MKHVLFVIAALMLVTPAFAQDADPGEEAAKKAEVKHREEVTSDIVSLSDQLDAAQSGDAAAQYNLGMRYYNGDGVGKDLKSAAMWLAKAADQGDMDAQASLGTMYQKGEGVPQSDQDAFRWYLQSAQQGNRVAQYNLATMYASGRGTRANNAQAYFWLTLAASMGGNDIDALMSSLEGRMTEAQIADIKKKAEAWEPNVRDTMPLSDIPDAPQ